MPASGANFTQDLQCTFQDVNEIKNSYVGAVAPTAPVTGVYWEDTSGASPVLKAYDGGWNEIKHTGGKSISGMIVPVDLGYYGDGANGSYTRVLGTANSVAGANAYLNSLTWYICDGSALNDPDSPIWCESSRYLPNLTDDRFIMGDTAAGAIGGENVNSHTHDCDPVSTTSSVESATVPCNYDAGGAQVANEDHTHDLDLASVTSAAASNTENRPTYLACLYAVKVKAVA